MAPQRAAQRGDGDGAPAEFISDGEGSASDPSGNGKASFEQKQAGDGAPARSATRRRGWGPDGFTPAGRGSASDPRGKHINDTGRVRFACTRPVLKAPGRRSHRGVVTTRSAELHRSALVPASRAREDYRLRTHTGRRLPSEYLRFRGTTFMHCFKHLLRRGRKTAKSEHCALLRDAPLGPQPLGSSPIVRRTGASARVRLSFGVGSERAQRRVQLRGWPPPNNFGSELRSARLIYSAMKLASLHQSTHRRANHGTRAAGGPCPREVPGAPMYVRSR
jgi:hypothetical protein